MEIEIFYILVTVSFIYGSTSTLHKQLQEKLESQINNQILNCYCMQILSCPKDSLEVNLWSFKTMLIKLLNINIQESNRDEICLKIEQIVEKLLSFPARVKFF